MWLAFLASFHKVQKSIRLHECRLHNILKTNLSFFLWRHSRALCLLRSSLFFGLPFFPFRPLPPLSRFRKKLETVGSFLSYCRQKTMKEWCTGMPLTIFSQISKTACANSIIKNVPEISFCWVKVRSKKLIIRDSNKNLVIYLCKLMKMM